MQSYEIACSVFKNVDRISNELCDISDTVVVIVLCREWMELHAYARHSLVCPWDLHSEGMYVEMQGTYNCVGYS